MGRRSLPRINPSLNLDAALLVGANGSEPFDAAAVFGRSAPLEIEIGSGKGLFLRTSAAAHPDRNFLGVEVAGKYARFVASRLVRDGGALAPGDTVRMRFHRGGARGRVDRAWPDEEPTEETP